MKTLGTQAQGFGTAMILRTSIVSKKSDYDYERLVPTGAFASDCLLFALES